MQALTPEAGESARFVAVDDAELDDPLWRGRPTLRRAAALLPAAGRQRCAGIA
ncbi:hypothetical protein ACIBMX_10490 [Streptomyces phaeochromogenes]|uniref:hypothetical protein n=1 Tax=Streptomyces phaeochromogenes TaxID=1923 RepID=UPI0033F0A999